MKKVYTASAATVLALAISVPAFAGGANCGSHSTATAVTADSYDHCAGKSKSAAWAGAWIQRSNTGTLTVADVAKNSPAAKAGLKNGDIVLAVNGYDLSSTEERELCASKATCSVGSSLTYTVQRGKSTKNIKLKLEKMPAGAVEKFASREASYDPMLGTVVMTQLQ